MRVAGDGCAGFFYKTAILSRQAGRECMAGWLALLSKVTQQQLQPQ